MRLTIALAQLNIITGNPDANLAKAEQMIADAARRGADIVVLPELWSTGYDLLNAARHAASITQGSFAQVAALARQHKVAVLGSSLSTVQTDRFGNTAVLFDAEGRNNGSYSKIHLFPLMDEPTFLTAGNNPGLIETPWGRSALAICYDLRFPELFRFYALNGAIITFVLAEWPANRLDHWTVLLRSRAIENQMYIVACNSTGPSRETPFAGHSSIIDPWGMVLVEADEREQLLMGEIRTEEVARVREKIPVFADRRPDMYTFSAQDALALSAPKKYKKPQTELERAEESQKKARSLGDLAAISEANKHVQEIRERIAKLRNDLKNLAGERIHLLEFTEHALRHCRQCQRNMEDHDYRMDQLRQEIERLGGSFRI